MWYTFSLSPTSFLSDALRQNAYWLLYTLQNSSHEIFLPQFPSPHRPSPMHPSEWGLGGPVVLVLDSGGTSAQLLILLPSQMGLENSSQIVYVTWIDILKIIESSRISNLIQQSALALLTALSKAERHFCTEKENLELFLSWILQDMKRSFFSVIAPSRGQYEAGSTKDRGDYLLLDLEAVKVPCHCLEVGLCLG